MIKRQCIDAYIFDCDGTLSAIEGITELARLNNCEKQVGRLTEAAMSHQGITPDLYTKRLNMVQPTKNQCKTVGQLYINRITPDIHEVIRALQSLNKQIYILSAGIESCVCILADFLSIPQEHVFAVKLNHDEKGNYRSYNHDSPMIQAQGKESIGKILTQKHDHLCAIGDGANDLPLQSVCTQFIGYGGAYYRSNIESSCQFYIKSSSMAPLLYLSLQENERQLLSTKHQLLYNKGKSIFFHADSV